MTVLALYAISSLINLNFGNLYNAHTLGACIPLYKVKQKSIGGISRYLGIPKKGVKIRYELKTELYADKCATFWMFAERFYRSFILQMTLIHSTIG